MAIMTCVCGYLIILRDKLLRIFAEKVKKLTLISVIIP